MKEESVGKYDGWINNRKCMNDFIFFLFAYDLHFFVCFYIKIIQKNDSMRKNIKSLEVLIMCGKDRIRTYETL